MEDFVSIKYSKKVDKIWGMHTRCCSLTHTCTRACTPTHVQTRTPHTHLSAFKKEIRQAGKPEAVEHLLSLQEALGLSPSNIPVRIMNGARMSGVSSKAEFVLSHSTNRVRFTLLSLLVDILT